MELTTTVSNALITAIMDGIPLDAAARARLLERSELDATAIRDINARTPILAFARFWAEVLRATGDDFIGLHIGREIPGGRFGLAPLAALNSHDVRQMLDRLTKYAPLINELILCSLEEEGSRARFAMKLRWDADGLERHAVDIMFVALIVWARERLGGRFVLREVRLAHGLSAARAAYEEIFRAPIAFGCARSELVFDAAVLDQPIADSNPELGSILDRYASAEIASVPVLADLPSRVTQLVLAALRGGQAIDLARICDALRTPPRQLQRKLRERKTSFSALLDAARRSLAPALLMRAGANVEQVGFQLGYAEPTAFIRAFKKWYRMTPGEYRKHKSRSDTTGSSRSR